MPRMPGLSLLNPPGRLGQVIDLAVEIEGRGFQAVTFNSSGDAMGMALAVSRATRTIRIGTTIVPIYWRGAYDLAQSAAVVHELSGGRFFLGLGVAHEPMHRVIGVEPGRPLVDMRAYVAQLREQEPRVGPLPPLVLAALRRKMTAL